MWKLSSKSSACCHNARLVFGNVRPRLRLGLLLVCLAGALSLAIGALCGCREGAKPAPTPIGSSAEAGLAGFPAPYWKGVVFAGADVDSTLRNNILNDLGASWWMTGNYQDRYIQDTRFVPMIWGIREGRYEGGICTTPSCLATYARNYPGRTWLLLQEPERAPESALSPGVAAREVGVIINAMRGASSSVKLFCCGTGADGLGLQWMQQFLAALTVPLDGIHVHAYYPANADERTKLLEGFYQAMQTIDNARGLPIWISEIGFQCSDGSSEWVRDSLAVPFFEWYRCGGGSSLYQRVAWYATNGARSGWTATHLYEDNWTRRPLADFYRAIGDIPASVPRPATPPVGQYTRFYPVADTMLNSWYTTRNYGLDTEIAVRNPDAKTVLLRFDLSTIPRERASLVSQARLLLYTSRPGTDAISVQAYRVLRPWNELEATWTRASSSVSWGRPGCNDTNTDRSGIREAAIQLRPEAGPWYEIDLTAAVRAWVADPASNQGIILKATGAQIAEYTFASVNHADTCWRPRLEVWYDTGPLPPTATPTPSPTSTISPSATHTSSPTMTALPSATHTPTPTSSPSPTATATSTGQPTATVTATGIATPTGTPTGTGPALPSPTTTASSTVTPTGTWTTTPSPIGSATATGTPPVSPTATPTLSAAETRVSGVEKQVPPLATRIARMQEILSEFAAVEWPGSGSAYSTARTLYALRAETAPLIDGDLSEWSGDGAIIVDASTADYRWGATKTADDPRLTVRARWNDNWLFLALRVQDVAIFTDSGPRPWHDDAVEIGLDGAKDRFHGGSDDHAFLFRPDGTFMDFDRPEHSVVRYVSFWSGGYDMEMAIPLSMLAPRVQSGTQLGITFGLRDDDDGGSLDTYLVWEGNDPYFGQAYFGTLSFSSSTGGALAPAQAPDSGPISGSVTLQQGLNAYGGVQDTVLVSGSCWDYNFVREGTLGISVSPERRVLLRFDLTGVLPTNATVTRAVLSLRTASGGSSPLTIRAYRLLRPWKSDEATWGRATRQTWWEIGGADKAGSDRASDVAATAIITAPDSWYDLDITALARIWATYPDANYGVLLAPDASTVAQYWLHSSESPYTGWRPKLTIQYQVP